VSSVSHAIRHVCVVLAIPSTHDIAAHIEIGSPSESRDLESVNGFFIGRYAAALEQHGGEGYHIPPPYVTEDVRRLGGPLEVWIGTVLVVHFYGLRWLPCHHPFSHYCIHILREVGELIDEPACEMWSRPEKPMVD
jgi:hypothetical protein